MKKKPIIVKSLTAGDFPPAVRVFWENFTGELNMLLAVVTTAIICYCGLAPRLRVKYCFDYLKSILVLNLLVICYSGAGKNMISYVVTTLLDPMIRRSRDERRRMTKGKKKKKKKKGDGEDEAEEEELFAVQFLQKFTLPVAVAYCDMMHQMYGDWMPFFLFGTELGSFIENKRNSSEFQSVARTAYSNGEFYSRDTLYQDGHNALVDMTWNSILTGQELALDKYITKDGVVEGDAGRQILFKISATLGEHIGTLKPLDEEQLALVQAMVRKLEGETYNEDGSLKPTHEVDMHWLDSDVKCWCNYTLEMVAKSGSNAMQSFYVRASSSAFRIATMLYYLWGEDPTKQKQVKRCYYYFAQTILDNAMAKWAKTYEAQQLKSEDNVKAPTLFDQMAKRFTRADLQAKENALGLSSPVAVILSKWKKKKWITEVENDVFEKLC